jgi:hypothetical protein
MSTSAFDDKASIPDETMLSSVLGEMFASWNRVRTYTSSTYEKVSEEWKFYSRSAGWSFAVKSKKRTLFYLIPVNGHFKAGFVLGGKATEEALLSAISEDIKKIITDAVQYPEGKSFMFDVKNCNDEDTIIKLIDIKNRN